MINIRLNNGLNYLGYFLTLKLTALKCYRTNITMLNNYGLHLKLYILLL